MTHSEYILREAKLPWDVNPNDAEELKLFKAVPDELWHKIGMANNHEEEVLAGDAVSDWINANWRSILPEMSAKFPEKVEKKPLADGYYLHVQDFGDAIIGPFKELSDVDKHMDFCKARGEGAGFKAIYGSKHSGLLAILAEDDCLISPEEDKSTVMEVELYHESA